MMTILDVLIGGILITALVGVSVCVFMLCLSMVWRSRDACQRKRRERRERAWRRLRNERRELMEKKW